MDSVYCMQTQYSENTHSMVALLITLLDKINWTLTSHI